MKKRVARMNDRLDFDSAFREARAVSADEFIWRGDRYHTRLATHRKSVKQPVLEVFTEDDPQTNPQNDAN